MNKTRSALGKKQVVGWLVALVLLLAGLALFSPDPVLWQADGGPKCCAGG
ncbi:hypothetical protein [Meiothermus taiwanensis]|jgi:hypothetical protein|nr:hypothetical protein [Meiothermus taiwanensis]